MKNDNCVMCEAIIGYEGKLEVFLLVRASAGFS